MKLESEYNKYVTTCKTKRIYPLAYSLWLENVYNRPKKSNAQEIGFDLNKDFTGKNNGTTWSTSEGEFL